MKNYFQNMMDMGNDFLYQYEEENSNNTKNSTSSLPHSSPAFLRGEQGFKRNSK